MDHVQIMQNLRDAPPPGLARVDYFHRVYSQITGWITTADKHWLCDFLPEVALAYPRDMRIVEVGTYGGSTARGLIALTGGRVVCVDNWMDHHPGDNGCETGPESFWKNLRTYGPDLSMFVDALLTGDSHEVGPRWLLPIDLLLIDGDHSYPGALADLRDFGRHVVGGGYCLVDDYDMPFVKQACDEFFGGAASDWAVVRAPPGGDEGHVLCARRSA